MSQRFKDVLYILETTLNATKKEYATMMHEKLIAPTEDDIEKRKAYIRQLMDAIDVLDGYDHE